MEHDFRPRLDQSFLERGRIADIGADITRNEFSNSGNPEQARLCRWIERVSEDLRALPAQPEAQPRALESGMTGDQNASAAPGICGCHHSFQGAPLSRQSSSRSRMSRNVSMGCQKPACLNAIN